jgi:hypothetical protein
MLYSCSIFREAQNCRDKKTLIFFFSFPLSSGKFGKQFLRFRAAKTFFFGITAFLYQNKIPLLHLEHWRQFCASLIYSKALSRFYEGTWHWCLQGLLD